MHGKPLRELTPEEKARFNAYAFLARSFARDRSTRYLPLGYQEIHAAALLGIYRACMDHDPSLGAKFTTFAYHCMRQQAFNDRMFALDRNRRERVYEPLELIPEDGRDIDPFEESHHEISEGLRRRFIGGLGFFSENERRIAIMRLEGKGTAEICQAVGLSKGRVCRIVRLVFKHFGYEEKQIPSVTRQTTRRNLRLSKQSTSQINQQEAP